MADGGLLAFRFKRSFKSWGLNLAVGHKDPANLPVLRIVLSQHLPVPANTEKKIMYTNTVQDTTKVLKQLKEQKPSVDTISCHLQYLAVYQSSWNLLLFFCSVWNWLSSSLSQQHFKPKAKLFQQIPPALLANPSASY
eukprot:6215749-Amphidinium_carterae.1